MNTEHSIDGILLIIYMFNDSVPYMLLYRRYNKFMLPIVSIFLVQSVPHVGVGEEWKAELTRHLNTILTPTRYEVYIV